MKKQKIVNIRYCGMQPTIDIGVDSKDHIYYANGIVTSNSHAVSYALNTYLSAYIKAHFPKAFFASYLYHAREKTKPFEEIHELVQNAKLMNIQVCSPDFRYMNKHFKLINKIIYFGLLDVKGVGKAAFEKIKVKQQGVSTVIKKEVGEWSWLDFLIYFSQDINSTAITSIINSGALSYMKMSRTNMTYEYNLYDKLTEREKLWINNYLHTQDTSKLELKDILLTMTTLATGKNGACASEKRKDVINSLLKTLIQPSYKLTDSPTWIAAMEESLLGIPLTCSSIDACDTSAANCTCIDYINNKTPKVIILAAKIDRINEIITKTGKSKGQKMAFLKISDITGSIDNIVVFPNVWIDAKKIAFLGNNILWHCEKSKDGGSCVVKQCWQI